MKSQYIIIDTGFLVALHTKKDKYYKKAVEVWEQIKHRKWITTWPVIVESCHFFIQKGNTQAVLLLFNILEIDLLELFPINKHDLSSIKTMMLKYKDLPMDLADASLVLLANNLNYGDIVSTDQRDFKTYRWKNHHPFHNLLA
ncbi:MAG: PIN domain-containing protein [Candidatus Protochlamydia sp.]|nr:PIN domain-containing protein [Candidatus Protochlamydia sp.]